MTLKDLKTIKNCIFEIETVDAINEILNHSSNYSFILRGEDGKEVNISKIINNSYISGNLLADSEKIRKDAIETLDHFQYVSPQTSDRVILDDDDI